MAQRIEPADYHELVRVARPALSPDGETVAFLRRTPADAESDASTVWTVPADGDGEPARFTAEEGVDGEPRWSPSGDRLAFTSDRGTDDGVPQLRVVPAAGGESRRVTDVPGGVSNVRWSPDGERIAFTQRTRPGEREAGHDCEAPDDHEREPPDPRVIDRTVYRAFQQYFDGANSHVYVAHLADDAVTRVTDGEYDFGPPAWGVADTLYTAVKRGTEANPDPDDSDEFTVEAYDVGATADGSAPDADSDGDSGGGEPQQITTFTSYQPLLAATADGRVAYLYRPPERMSMRQTEVEVYDREREETTRLTAGFDRTIATVLVDAGIEWGPDEERVYFLTPDEGRRPLRAAGPDGVEVVTGGTLSDFSLAGDAVAYAKSEPDHPGDLFVSDGSSGSSGSGTDSGGNAGGTGSGDGGGRDGERRLTSVNEAYFADRAVGDPEELRYENDGVEIQGWVLTPPGFDPEGEYPLAVEIHGGPHSMWTPTGSVWHEFQSLAAAGYVVFWCNPRGSVGYGEAFATAIERDWGDATSADVLAGADLVADRAYVDADQQFVTGGSFGGYMTAWLVGHTDRFDGAVAQRGVYELSSFYGSTDGAYKLVEGEFDAVPWEEPEFLWERSPAAYADDVTTPTLVMHAEEDYRVPLCNAELLYRFLRKGGVDTRLVQYPREGHELSRSGEPGHVVDRIERIVRWFDGYSRFHDAPRALDREPNAGLSTAEEAAEGEGTEETSAGGDETGEEAGTADGRGADDGVRMDEGAEMDEPESDDEDGSE